MRPKSSAEVLEKPQQRSRVPIRHYNGVVALLGFMRLTKAEKSDAPQNMMCATGKASYPSVLKFISRV
jgi:hypothetical protein